MSRAVWTRSMGDTRPRIHRADNFKLRPASVTEQLMHGFVPDDGQRTEVSTTNCGIACAIWLEEPDPHGPWYRSVRWESLGVRLLARHARLLPARWCKKCWPEAATDAAEATS